MRPRQSPQSPHHTPTTAGGGRPRSAIVSIDDPVGVLSTLGSVQDTLSSLGQRLEQLGAGYNASYNPSPDVPGLTVGAGRSQQATTYELARDLLHAAAMTHQAAARLERAQALLTELCYDVHLPIPEMPPARRVPGISL